MKNDTSSLLTKTKVTLYSKPNLWNRLSLRSQLIMIFAIIILAIILSITIVSIQRESRILRGELEQSALSLTDALEAALQDFLYFLDIDTITDLGDSFSNYPNVLAITIYDPNGRVLYASANPMLEARLDADPFGASLVNNNNLYMEYERDRLITGRSYIVGRQVLGAARVELSTNNLTTAVQASVNRGILSGLLASIVGILAITIVSRTITESIRELVDTTSRIAKGDFSSDVKIRGGSEEIGALADAIDDMRENLQSIYQDMETRIAERTEDLKKARDDAIAAQQVAQENSRLKSEFLSTMSHELRTPLNAIEGFTSIMLSGMGVELSPRAEDMVKRVSANSKRLLYLINDFLDLSRIESGRLELTKEPLSPIELVQTWEEEIGVLAKEKNLDFIISVSDKLPATIIGDEDALSKIVINLLGNAFKFTHEGQVSLDLQPVDESWAIVVSDTGIGIPPYAREYIFDEFRQVDGSSKRLYGGTGLGLALVQKLARAMDGTVTLQSEVGVGSVFTVTLPLELGDEIG